MPLGFHSIWILAAVGALVILFVLPFIVRLIYKRYIAKCFQESQEQNATSSNEMASQQRPLPVLPNPQTASAPAYEEVDHDAPPSYEEAIRGDL